MKQSDIHFNIALDDQNVPETITWEASDKPSEGLDHTNAIAVSVWDNETRNTMRMDLWTKEMTVTDMKRFAVDSIGGLAETIQNATGDTVMSEQMHELCRNLVKHVEAEMKKEEKS
jgi:gliding motility-associated protein GldC